MGTHGRLELTLLSRRPAGLIGSVVIARLRRRRHGRGRSRRSHRSFLATTCGCLLQLQLMLRSALIPLLTFSLCRSLLRATALQLLKLTPSCVGTPLLLFCKGRNARRLELSGDCIFVCPRPWRLRRRSWSRILNVQPDSESIPIHSDNLELCFSRHGPRAPVQCFPAIRSVRSVQCTVHVFPFQVKSISKLEVCTQRRGGKTEVSSSGQWLMTPATYCSLLHMNTPRPPRLRYIVQ